MYPSMNESLWPEGILLARKGKIYYQEMEVPRNNSYYCFLRGRKYRIKSQKVGYHQALVGHPEVLGLLQSRIHKEQF